MPACLLFTRYATILADALQSHGAGVVRFAVTKTQDRQLLASSVMPSLMIINTIRRI